MRGYTSDMRQSRADAGAIALLDVIAAEDHIVLACDPCDFAQRLWLQVNIVRRHDHHRDLTAVPVEKIRQKCGDEKEVDHSCRIRTQQAGSPAPVIIPAVITRAGNEMPARECARGLNGRPARLGACAEKSEAGIGDIAIGRDQLRQFFVAVAPAGRTTGLSTELRDDRLGDDGVMMAERDAAFAVHQVEIFAPVRQRYLRSICPDCAHPWSRSVYLRNDFLWPIQVNPQSIAGWKEPRAVRPWSTCRRYHISCSPNRRRRRIAPRGQAHRDGAAPQRADKPRLQG